MIQFIFSTKAKEFNIYKDLQRFKCIYSVPWNKKNHWKIRKWEIIRYETKMAKLIINTKKF